MNLTIQEFARQAGVTSQAVYKRLKTDLKEFATIDNGRKCIDDAALQLFQKPETAAGVDNEAQQEAAKVDNELNQLKTENERLKVENQLQTVQIEGLKQQVTQQREQIEDLRQQAARLDERLREAHILANNTQQLLLTDGRRRWWDRFRRKPGENTGTQ